MSLQDEIDWDSIEGSETLSAADKTLIAALAAPSAEERRQQRRKEEDAPGNLEAALS